MASKGFSSTKKIEPRPDDVPVDDAGHRHGLHRQDDPSIVPQAR
jgi:hypothetical protein